MKNKYIASIIKATYDLHLHMGPEIIPRKYNSFTELNTLLAGKVAGVGLKNHFFSTIQITKEGPSTNLKLIGSVVLNNYVGGLNPDAIYAASTLADGPFIVWFPTINAKQFLDNSDWEIAPEWVNKKSRFSARKSNDVASIRILDSKLKLTKSAIRVLMAIKKTGAILATGHISWQESRALVTYASKIGITKIIITHPIYQRINMSLKTQFELAQLGAKIEQCWSMWKIDNIPIKTIANQIKTIGAINCIITSDSGQSFSPPPNLALYEFCERLFQEGISLNELKTMCITNPKILIAK